MLAQANRVNLSKEFKKFKDHGQVVETPLFRMAYLPSSTGEPRFGFVVTNKIGSATERNRSRRLLREVVRLRLASLPLIEAVLIGRHRLPQATYEDINRNFDQAISKISLPR